MSHTSHLTHGTLWSALERFSTIGIQLVCTFVLARFLMPADFGLVGMLVVFTLIGNTLTESGFSQALIREREVSSVTYSTVFWANLILSLIVYAALFASAPLIAQFYHEPQLIDVSRITFLTIPLGALSLIHYTIYTRELRFRRLCLISLTASLLSCVAAIAYAWHTHSLWALVVQNVLAYTLRTIGFWLTNRTWHPRWQFSFPELRRLFRFSRNLLITGLIGNLFNNIYTLLIGRFYGATQAGYFVQADRIRMVASTSATQVIQSVSYPILSQINNEAPDALLKSAYRRIILSTLLLVGTCMALLMGISEDLMELLLGAPEWRTSGRYLFALGVAGILFPLHAVNQNILLVKGMGRTVLWVEVARRSLMILLLFLTLRFDVELFVWSYALYSFLLIFLNLWVCGRPIGYTLGEQLRDIRSILFRLLLLVVSALVSNHLFALFSPLSRMLFTLTVSLTVCVLLFWRHPVVRDLQGVIRNLFSRSQQP